MSLDPGQVPAVLEQDEAEVAYDERKGLADARSGVGVVVAVQRHHRTSDAPPQSEQLATRPQLFGLPPDARKYLILDGKPFRIKGHGIIRVRLGGKLADAGEG